MNTIQIGIYLQKLRKSKDWTQQDLAKLLDVSHQAVSRWEKGDNLPDVIKLRELSLLYDISIDEIVNCEEESKKYKGNAEFNPVYLTVNVIASLISIMLYYVLFITSGKLWISVIAQYSIVLGISMVYIIPYAKLPRTKENYKYFRYSMLVNLFALFATISSFMVTWDQVPSGLFIALLLWLPVVFLLCFILNIILEYFGPGDSGNRTLKEVISKYSIQNTKVKYGLLLGLSLATYNLIIYAMNPNSLNDFFSMLYIFTIITGIVVIWKRFNFLSLSLFLIHIVNSLIIWIFIANNEIRLGFAEIERINNEIEILSIFEGVIITITIIIFGFMMFKRKPVLKEYKYTIIGFFTLVLWQLIGIVAASPFSTYSSLSGLGSYYISVEYMVFSNFFVFGILIIALAYIVKNVLLSIEQKSA